MLFFTKTVKTTLLLLFIVTKTLSAQPDSSKIANTTFPENWDKNRNLRGKKGQILAWKHFKYGSDNEYKSCLMVFDGLDSSGNTEYFISEMYANKKPFNKWSHQYNYLRDYFTSPSGLKFGFWDLHLEIFKHKPNESELDSLLKRWEFVFPINNPDMIESGIDDKLWLTVFGYLPNRRLLISKE